jgi:hypothetical protein
MRVGDSIKLNDLLVNFWGKEDSDDAKFLRARVNLWFDRNKPISCKNGVCIALNNDERASPASQWYYITRDGDVFWLGHDIENADLIHEFIQILRVLPEDSIALQKPLRSLDGRECKLTPVARTPQTIPLIDNLRKQLATSTYSELALLL